MSPLIYSVDNFDYSTILALPNVKRTAGNPRTKHPRDYVNCVVAFDIESSTLPGTDTAFMYVWQMAFNDTVVMGRTWEEFSRLLHNFADNMPPDRTLLIFVHNLSYEFQFMRAIYDFKPEEVFAMASRKVLKCSMFEKKIEFRCSYIQTNMSLDQFTAKFHVKHGKLDGKKFNYKTVRYPWTKLTDNQLAYCINDVLGLTEALRAEMSRDNDTLVTIPLTSTGYVRRDVKRAMQTTSFRQIKAMQPTPEVYRALREAFRGGNTHANRYYTGHILDNVQSADRSSSYPDVLVNCRFPMTEFVPAACNSWQMLNSLRKLGRAILCRVVFYGIELKDRFDGCPYLSKSKCRNIKNAVCDNGRILCADYLETTLTDIDLDIVTEKMAWEDIVVIDLWSARYGRLPNVLPILVNQYYRMKTELKGDEAQAIYYDKSKALLNAIYGLMAQDPVKLDVIFNGMDFENGEEDIDGKLLKSNNKAYLAYAWGVWTTAYARLRLQEMVNACGDRFVYADTDSVKYLGYTDFSDYNKLRVADSTKNGAYAMDKNGEIHYMGVFEQEKSYSKFITLGAKKYAFMYSGSKDIHITVAGVSKKEGGKELKKAGGLEKFKEGFVFTEAGGLEAVYNDCKPYTITIGKHKLETGANICLKQSTYTLGITAEYAKIIENPQYFVDIWHNLA